MTLDRSRRDYFDRVLELIEAEPNFAARILATANSATSAPLVPVTTLATAIARLGGAASANLVLAASVTHVFVPQDDWEKSLWRHAIQVAVTSRAMATRGSDGSVDPQEAYACGLLHDIGRFIILQEAPDELREIDEGSWDAPDALVRKELAICGVTHAELGAMACEKWGIPYLIEEVVRHHHQVDPASAITPAGKLTAIVRVADFAMFPVALPGTPGIAEAPGSVLLELAARLPSFVALNVDELRRLIDETTAEAETTCEALGVA
jgi:putative nucleotidyltransferase with HDIG domain